LVALHKKGDRVLLDNYRGITLLNTSGKVFVAIVLQRISPHLLGQLLDAQHGFRPGRGTGGALFCMRRLTELAREWGTPLHAGFVDFRKAFDSVPRPVLWALLRARGVAPKLVRLLVQLYTGARACVRVGGAESEWFSMRSGVRQGCPLSPLLFNTFMDFLARQLMQLCRDRGVSGFRVCFRAGAELVPGPLAEDLDSGRVLAALMLLYADDLVVLADSAEGLQQALLALEELARQWGMQLNYAKTKCMVIGTRRGAGGEAAELPQPLQLAGGALDFSDSFCYLGCHVSADASLDRELDSRLQHAGRAFAKLTHIWKAPRSALSTDSKVAVFSTCVMPVLTYGAAETWALTQDQWRRVQVFQTTCLRQLLGERRVDGNTISNEDLLDRAQQMAVQQWVEQRMLVWLGHAARAPADGMINKLLHATAPHPTAEQLERTRRGGDAIGRFDSQGRPLRSLAQVWTRQVMGPPPLTWGRAVQTLVSNLPGLEAPLEQWFKACQNRAEWKLMVYAEDI